MESEIVNYANKISPIMRRLLEDSNFYNTATHFLGLQSLGEKPEEYLLRLPELGVAYLESIGRITARQKEISELAPPIEAKSHHTKLLMACQKKEQALAEFLAYTCQLLEQGVGESSRLKRGNDLLRENNQLLEEAKTELLKLYKKVGK